MNFNKATNILCTEGGACRLTWLLALTAIIVATFLPSTAAAQPSVLVEGNCTSGETLAPRTTVSPGTCGDYDGDGRIGRAEDTDEDDAIFGTIDAALRPDGIIQSATVTIVTSGRFDGFAISGVAGGNVTVQAAPGVTAVIAPLGGRRREGTGILIANGISGSFNTVVLRNLEIRDFSTGIVIEGGARVAIEGCRVQHNLQYGIEVQNTARVSIDDTKIYGTGYIESITDDTGQVIPASPGTAIEFRGTSSGAVFSTTISGNRGVGVSNQTGNSSAVCVASVNFFDNGTNFVNVAPQVIPCGFNVRTRNFPRRAVR